MPLFLKKITVLIGVWAAILCANAYCVPLRIFDCNGTTRAIRDVASSSKNEVTIDTSNPDGSSATSSGSKVTLTNALTGEVITATIVSSEARFEGITEGDWILGSPNSTLVFSAITVGNQVPAPLAFGAAAGAGILGGGLLAAGVEAIDDTQGKSSASIPTPVPTTVTTPKPPPATPKPSGDLPCPDCKPDEPQKPIDDFFQAAEQPNGATEAQRRKNLDRRGNQASDCFIGNDVNVISPFQ